jgi:hypothetical protein
MFNVNQHQPCKEFKAVALCSMGDVTFMAGIKVALEERNSLDLSAFYRGKHKGHREI